MKRLFIAIPITLNHEFQRLTDHLKSCTSYDTIVWTQAKVQHLTLRFIGETPDFKIPSLTEALNSVFANTAPFQLTIDKLGVFGSHYHPTTLWLGFNHFDTLKEIHNRIESVLADIGFESDRGNFVPHITLGRIKRLANKNKFWQMFEQNQPIQTQKLDVDSIILYRSKLKPEGPVYSELARWDLQR